MKTSEALFFIGKCLTIDNEPKNKNVIRNQLITQQLDWELIITIGSKHYVLPAFCEIMKRNDFLKFLPLELASFMIKITEENKKRNQQILQQIKSIETLMLEHQIRPIFIKGAGNIKQNLYINIAERMVGDIDILIEKSDTKKAQNLLIGSGYKPIQNGPYIKHRHLKRLFSDDFIAAVEIHEEVVSGSFVKKFDSETIISNSLFGTLLKPYHQLVLAVAAHQINDKGRIKYTYSLRNAYDSYLINVQFNSQLQLYYKNKGCKLINDFLYQTKVILNSDLIPIEPTKLSKIRLFIVLYFINHPNLNLLKNRIIKEGVIFRARVGILIKALFSIESRKYVIHQLKSKEWQQRKLKKLGIIKS